MRKDRSIDYSLFSTAPYFIGRLLLFFAIYTPTRDVLCVLSSGFALLNRVRFPLILASERITGRNPLTRHVLCRTNSVASRSSTWRRLIMLTSQVRYRRLCTAHAYAPLLPSTSRNEDRVFSVPEKVENILNFYGICRINFSSPRQYLNIKI